jgi:hypothetical protein
MEHPMTLAVNTVASNVSLLSPATGGIYRWKVGEDLVYADQKAAMLFGIPEDEADEGLPIIRYLRSIHPDDLERVSHAILSAVEAGSSYRTEYRVLSACGKSTPVLAMGQCFHDQRGNPTEYAGMVFILDHEPTMESEEDKLIASCIGAFKHAKKAGNDLISYLLSMALIELGQKAARDLLPEGDVH